VRTAAKVNLRGRRKGPRRDVKTFLLVLLIALIPTVSSVLLVSVSARPSFEDRVFSPNECHGDAALVNWRTLLELDNPHASLVQFPAELLAPTICVAGYMLQFALPPVRQGNVTEFLLVPDPGNWLHPPHLEAGEVILVRTEQAQRTPLLQRQAVWVRGRMIPSLFRSQSLESAYQMTAFSVESMKDKR
jgi:hypothetical protein